VSRFTVWGAAVKNHALNLLIWLLAAASVASTSWGVGTLLRTEPAPLIELEHTSIDFGLLEPFATAIEDVTVTNTGDGPAFIDHVHTTCGCTSGTVSKSEIAPGESAILRIKADVSQLRNTIQFQQVISLQVRVSGRSEQIMLRVRGRVDRSEDLRAIPARLHTKVARGDAVPRTITLIGERRILDGLPSVIEFDGISESITGESNGAVTEVAAREIVILCRAPENAAPGARQGEISIEISASNSHKVTTTIPVRIEVVDPIFPFPQQLYAAIFNQSEPVSITLSLRSWNGAHVAIDSIESDAAGLDFALSANAPEAVIRIDPAAWPPGISRSTLRVRTSGNSVIDVPLFVVHSGAARDSDGPAGGSDYHLKGKDES